MAVNGTTELVLGPGVFLTDYARETARQFNITLINEAQQQNQAAVRVPAVSSRTSASDKYNKPAGCQHGPISNLAVPSRTTSPSNQTGNEPSANTVERLVNLMGKVIKRGS